MHSVWDGQFAYSSDNIHQVLLDAQHTLKTIQKHLYTRLNIFRMSNFACSRHNIQQTSKSVCFAYLHTHTHTHTYKSTNPCISQCIQLHGARAKRQSSPFPNGIFSWRISTFSSTCQDRNFYRTSDRDTSDGIGASDREVTSESWWGTTRSSSSPSSKKMCQSAVCRNYDSELILCTKSWCYIYIYIYIYIWRIGAIKNWCYVCVQTCMLIVFTEAHAADMHMIEMFLCKLYFRVSIFCHVSLCSGGCMCMW